MPIYYPTTTFIPQFIDPLTGDLMSGGTIEVYESNTSTPTEFFLNADGDSAGQVVELNGGGYPEVGGDTVVLWLPSDQDVKIVVKDARGNIKYDIPVVPASGAFTEGIGEDVETIRALAETALSQSTSAITAVNVVQAEVDQTGQDLSALTQSTQTLTASVSTLATDQASLSGDVTTVTASVQTQATAIAELDTDQSALATAQASLSTTVTALDTSVTQQSSAISDLENGVASQWEVKTTAAGVTGSIGLYNDNGDTRLLITADKVEIKDPDGDLFNLFDNGIINDNFLRDKFDVVDNGSGFTLVNTNRSSYVAVADLSITLQPGVHEIRFILDVIGNGDYIARLNEGNTNGLSDFIGSAVSSHPLDTRRTSSANDGAGYYQFNNLPSPTGATTINQFSSTLEITGIYRCTVEKTLSISLAGDIDSGTGSQLTGARSPSFAYSRMLVDLA